MTLETDENGEKLIFKLNFSPDNPQILRFP